MIKSYQTEKKSQMSYSEISLIIIAIVIVGFTLFFSSIQISHSKQYLNKMPEISYEFPSLFIDGFLNLEISKDDIKSLNLNENNIINENNADINNKKYFIKDLIYLNSDNANKIIKKYKENYIDESLSISKISSNSNSYNNENMHELFQQFSNTKYNPSYDNLLNIKIIDSLKDETPLVDYIKNKNYYYYIRTKDNKIALIIFRNSN